MPKAFDRNRGTSRRKALSYGYTIDATHVGAPCQQVCHSLLFLGLEDLVSWSPAGTLRSAMRHGPERGVGKFLKAMASQLTPEKPDIASTGGSRRAPRAAMLRDSPAGPCQHRLLPVV